jgi:nucleotide-binding universal stress UspA family protein
MALKHLLVHADGGERAGERLRLAATLARRSGALLTGLFAENASLGSSIVGRRNPDNVARARAAAHGAFDAAAEAAGVASEWLQLDEGEYGHVVGWTILCCRYADLAIFGQHDPAHERLPEDALEQILSESGRPLLVVPSTGHFADLGRRVLIAWTGSRESARAVNDALPLMQGAEEVTVLAFQLEGRTRGGPPAPRLDIAGHLRAHGIAARYERTIVDDVGMVDTVLNRSADLGADLTVVGGYGLGGPSILQRSATVRGILRSMTTPVLISC